MYQDILAEIIQLVKQHDTWRASCLNLVAAENVASPLVNQFALSDLAGRYGDYLGRDLTARKYFGTQYVVQIEKKVVELAQHVFRAEYVEIRPLSGHVAGASVIMGLTRPGDCVLELGSDGGGHRLAEKLTHTALARLNVRFLPVDGQAYNVDVARTTTMIEELRPTLIILGSSNFLFPHPVSQIADALHRIVPGALLAYDASHVLGLIAGGCFQDPLREGADLMFGSTHKTFPGPHGGLVFSNSEDTIRRVSEACYPGLVTNHHLSRSPGLAVALLEMLQFGSEYARTVISNSQAFAAELARSDLKVVGADNGFTRSHTVLAQTSSWGNSKEIAAWLESGNIIANSVTLPPEQGDEGLRFGLQELTRRGATQALVSEAANLVAAIVKGELVPEQARPRSEMLARQLQGLRYSLDAQNLEVGKQER